jgi:DNA primase RepB-like protein
VTVATGAARVEPVPEKSHVVHSDGAVRRARFSGDEQASLWTRALHHGRPGLVEVVAGRRQRDGSLRMRSRERPENYPRAGDRDALVRLVRRHREAGLEVFCTPLTRRHPRPGRAGAILPAAICWVDIDDPDAVAPLRAFPQRPHLVVRSGSGGVHAYWRLGRPLQPAAVEEANRRLAGALGGDLASTDSPRIMRVPGTTNHKAGRPCHLAYVDLARPGFTPERLVAGLDDPAPAPPPPDERTLARWAEQNARDPAKQIPPPVYFRLLAGETVAERGGDVRCPLPDHPDENPSCRVYPTAEQGWRCHGCGRGGSIYDLASLLEGGPWGRALRDEQFKRIKDAVWQLLGIASDRPSQAQRKASAPRHEAARSDSNHKEEER